ncbi:MAG: hypothetical protein PHY62_07055, partial [Gallionella sp.]|nr:hypothetical protein [Gallionella sp.]
MATNIGTLADLAINQAYLDPRILRANIDAGNNNITVGSSSFTVVTVSTQNGGGYSGQVIKSTTGNEYFLLDRGTEPGLLGNLAADFFGIALGTFGAGFNTSQMQSAQAYAKVEFTRLAQGMVNGTTTIDTLNLVGHSSGYAQAIKQYETLSDLYKNTPAVTPETPGLKEAYGQLLSKVKIFGVNGAGVPNSTLPTGALDTIAVNLVVPGDVVDNAGKQYGIQISLDGAGSGYGSAVLGAAGAVVLGITGLRILAAGAAGGIAGNHPGSNATAYMSKFPAYASLTQAQLASLSNADRNALIAVDQFTWDAMTSTQRDALLSTPTLVVADLQVHGLTPASIQLNVDGLGSNRYTFATGVSYLYKDSGGVKTYVFSPLDGNPGVTVSVYSNRVEYRLPDNSISTVYNTGDAQTAVGAFTYNQPAGNAQATITAGGQTFTVPAEAVVSESGSGLLVQNSGSNGYPSLLINPDGSATQFNYDATGDYLGATQIGTGSIGTTTNTFTCTITDPTGIGSTTATDPITPVSSNDSTLLTGGNYVINGVGNVNTDGGNTASANYIISNDYRPGAGNIADGTLNNTLDMLYPVSTNLNPSVQMALSGTTINLGNSIQTNLTATDPLILDLNGDGVKLTSFAEAPVLFDIDHDGGAKELTGWVSAQDGIVAYDLNGNGKIDDISETLSEYFNGAVGTGGNAGVKTYANGFAALKSLDSNADNQFTSLDTAFNNVRVWVDTNHDGISFVDTNNNGIKETTEASELKTLTELGITAINLAPTTQSGLVNGGNEILATGSFTQTIIASGQGVPVGTAGATSAIRQAQAARFIANPTGNTITSTATGTTVSATDGQSTYVSA